MKNFALILTTLAALAGCAELPSASKQSLLNSETTIRPQPQVAVVTSRGSLVPAAQVNATPYRVCLKTAALFVLAIPSLFC